MESTNAKAAMTAEQRALIEEEDKYRQSFAEGDASYEDPHVLLHDVFGLPAEQWQYKPLSPEESRIPSVLTQHAQSLSGRSIVGSLGDFQKNWKEFTQGMFDGMDWNNVMVAGGAVLGPLTNQGGSDLYGQSDIDVFIYGIQDDEEANRKLKQIHALIQRNTNSQGSVIRTKRTVTIINTHPFRHVQIILKLYKSPAEVLLGFDVDCCTFGYDGSKVWVMERGRRAVTRRYNLVNETRRSTSYEGRLYKYSKRGFIALVPGLDKGRVHSGIYQMRPWQATGLAKLLVFDYKATNQPEDLDETDESDYNPDLQIPWGPEWTTSRILAKLNAKDKSQFFANKFRDHNAGLSQSSTHNHLFIVGIDELIKGQFWCEQCHQHMQLPTEDAPGNFVSTRITWLKKCPAYQDIDKGFKRELLSGSFQPALDPDWKGMAYSGPPSDFVPTRTPARSRSKKMGRRAARRFNQGAFHSGAAAAPAFGSQPSLFAQPKPAALPFQMLSQPTAQPTLPSFGGGAGAVSLAGSFACEVCKSTFNSTNLLRKHVRDTGHFAGFGIDASAAPFSSTSSATSSFVSSPSSLSTSSFITPATKLTAPVVASKESVDRFNPSAVDPFVTDLSQFGPQPGSSSPSSFSYGYASPVVHPRDESQSSAYGSPYKPPQQSSTFSSAASSTTTNPTSYDDMNPAARALYLISQCYKSGQISESDRRKLKELFIKGSEIITAAVEVYDIDRDANELYDTLKRVAHSS